MDGSRRFFKTRFFERYARKQRIEDRSLIEAVLRADEGLIDADLGGGLIKQRIARIGRGKSAGYRVILTFKAMEHVYFLFGFAKNDQGNVSAQALEELRILAESLAAADEPEIGELKSIGGLVEIEAVL